MNRGLAESTIMPLIERYYLNDGMLKAIRQFADEHDMSSDNPAHIALVVVEQFIIDNEDRMLDTTIPYNDVYESIRAEVLVNENEYIELVTGRLRARDAQRDVPE